MKLRNQLILSIIAFGIVLLFISASVVITNQQVAQINNNEQTANSINTGASNLAYIANDYFLYRQSTQLNSWQAQFSSLQEGISNLESSNPEQMAQIQIVEGDLQRLGTVFNSSVSILQNVPQNESASAFPAFQTASGRLNIQNQALAFDASVLSNSFEDQANQLKQTNSFLIFALLGAFGAYFVMIYFIVFRRTFRSITKLQEGTKIIGSGNLDYSVASRSNDEIGELSRYFDQMTSNLKTVTASKTDLEQEIDQRKKMENALRKSEQSYRELFTSMTEMFQVIELIYDKDGKTIDYYYREVNPAFEQLVQKTREQLVGKRVKDIFGVVEDYWLEVYDKVAKTGEPIHFENYGAALDKWYAIYAWKPNEKYIAITFTDITKRKKAEKALRESEQRWATTLSSIGDAVISTDMTGKISFMNGIAEVLTGWTLIEALQRPIREIFNIVNEQTRLEVENPINKVLREGMVVGLANHTVLIRKDGTEIPIDDSGAPIKDKDGKPLGVVLVFRDITERKQSEEKLEEYRNNLEILVEERTKQLKYSERLAAIGATAGMVGHDIRNPLQAITGDVYLAKTELASTPESEEKNNIQESLIEIEKNIDYINKIVQDLQDYARPLNPKTEEIDLKLIIADLLAKQRLPDNIELSFKVENKAEKICADSYYINRIMYNIVTNAVQAMPNGGRLTIHAFREPNDLVMTVKDTGVGIPKKIADKMFTLMFTTKSKGQGFGLPVVKRMTESLGGTVTFESQEGKGTTFTVRLPLTR
jgi:PAS domain S-box-containing protein